MTMQINEIKTVCFVGAGTMGCFNSLLAGIGGYEAVLFDISEEMLQSNEIRQEIMGAGLVEQNIFTAAQVIEGRKRIRLESDPAKAVENADLLSESVPEILELKRSVHKQFDGLCPAHTIMTTNTSNMLVSEIEEGIKRGDRFAAMHFHLASTLVDIIGGTRTSRQTIDILSRFVKSINCIPYINKKENAGYVFNAVLRGMMDTALALVVQHKECIWDVDRAWMICGKKGVGPFGILDMVGVNVCYDGTLNTLRYPEKRELAEKMLKLLHPFIQKGDLGMKTGKGFYSYPDAAYQQPDFLKPDQNDANRYQAMVNGTIIQALLMVMDNVASFEDVDRTWMLATNLKTGPFGWLDDKGIDSFLSEIKNPVYDGIYPTDRMDDIVAFLSPFMGQSELGIKSGQGF
jgi:enoyl-CoA hydratase/3-hydroxyacyl-CoA dehydrogenase